jgi:hypothetical protein
VVILKGIVLGVIYTFIFMLVIGSFVGALCFPLLIALIIMIPCIFIGSHARKYSGTEKKVVRGVKKVKEKDAWDVFMEGHRKDRRARKEEERKNPKPKMFNPVILLRDILREKKRRERKGVR